MGNFSFQLQGFDRIEIKATNFEIKYTNYILLIRC